MWVPARPWISMVTIAWVQVVPDFGGGATITSSGRSANVPQISLWLTSPR